jgi:hypothetical protein
MCYELSSWHWKLRARELDKTRPKADATEQKAVAAEPVEQPQRTRPEAKLPEKVRA